MSFNRQGWPVHPAADCLLLPSIAEGFPVSARGGARKRAARILADDPVYAPYVAGAPDGVVLSERSVGALVEALRSIGSGRLIDAGQRERLAEFAAERYSLDRSIDRHEDLYARLVAGRGRLS